ncbi:hypothetical protein AB0B63_07020 [Micromonospora sp. NPDC049081]|uniref:hypothetical protein n=1 Tax=Micromonospora sp. NPDC049081 TaxID=3155150 RepID=UPI0033CB7907
MAPARDPQIPELLTLPEAAARLGYSSRQALLNRYNRGEVPGAEAGRSIIFRADLIDEMARAELGDQQ